MYWGRKVIGFSFNSETTKTGEFFLLVLRKPSVKILNVVFKGTVMHSWDEWNESGACARSQDRFLLILSLQFLFLKQYVTTWYLFFSEESIQNLKTWKNYPSQMRNSFKSNRTYLVFLLPFFLFQTASNRINFPWSISMQMISCARLFHSMSVIAFTACRFCSSHAEINKKRCCGQF